MSTSMFSKTSIALEYWFSEIITAASICRAGTRSGFRFKISRNLASASENASAFIKSVTSAIMPASICVSGRAA